ncbi:uncharacterized protein LOC131950041 [Physella acuta]|uniref:uncharacterized protein LOC131950041 n=1 Tax=Physella acuta TaxID=109671 RepID=UPI0027DB4AC1|nr:uncharacterized protein LOC131950041 [Physella acuta]
MSFQPCQCLDKTQRHKTDSTMTSSCQSTIQYLIIIALFLLLTLTPAQGGEEENDCGEGCQFLYPDIPLISRCVKYSCRRRVFQNFIRFGKRSGNSEEPLPLQKHPSALKNLIRFEQRSGYDSNPLFQLTQSDSAPKIQNVEPISETLQTQQHQLSQEELQQLTQEELPKLEVVSKTLRLSRPTTRRLENILDAILDLA